MLRCSGDGTVPYYSLSWAHAWHVDEHVNIIKNKEKIKPFFQHLGERANWTINTSAFVNDSPLYTLLNSRIFFSCPKIYSLIFFPIGLIVIASFPVIV